MSPVRNKTIRALGATVVLVGVAVAAIAQVGSDEPPATEIEPVVSASTSTPTDSEPTPSAIPALDYRVGLLAGLSTDNFWAFVGEEPTAWNAYVLGPTKPALFGIDPVTNELVPELGAGTPPQATWDATGWRVRVDLDHDLAWSDGVPVTAHDVVYTFRTVRRLGLGGGWADGYPDEVEDMVAESDHELRIELAVRPSLQVWPYGVGLAPIMPAHVWEPVTGQMDTAADVFGLTGEEDVSGGPLQLLTVGPDLIEAVGNPGHPDGFQGSVRYVVFPDEAAAVVALMAGEIDTILNPNGLAPASRTDLEDEPGIELQESPANAVRYLGFNLTRQPMGEPAFRQSLALLLDREAARENLVPDASAAYTLLSPSNRSWFDVDQADGISAEFDGDLASRLDRALAALAGAGYVWAEPPTVDGTSIVAGSGLTIDGRAPAPLTIVTPGDEYDPARPDYTQRIESTLEALGFDVRPVVTDFDTVIDLAFTVDGADTRQYDMYLLGWTLGNPALPDYYRWFFSEDGPFNSTGYADPEFETMLGRYETAPDVETARNALWEMERILAEDLPYLVLYHPEIDEAYRSDRVGFGVGATLGGIQGRSGGVTDLIAAP